MTYYRIEQGVGRRALYWKDGDDSGVKIIMSDRVGSMTSDGVWWGLGA